MTQTKPLICNHLYAADFLRYVKANVERPWRVRLTKHTTASQTVRLAHKWSRKNPDLYRAWLVLCKMGVVMQKGTRT